MGLFGGDSKTVKRQTSINKRIFDTDTETVLGPKVTGGSDLTQAGPNAVTGSGNEIQRAEGDAATRGGTIQKAGGDIGLTGKRFAQVATNLSGTLNQGVQALAAGARQATTDARQASTNATRVANAATGAGVSPVTSSTPASGAGAIPWGPVVLGIGAIVAIGLVLRSSQ